MSGLDLAGLGYDAQRAAAARFLTDGGQFTTDELAAALGVSPTRAGDILREFFVDGRVSRSGRPFRYSLPT